MAGPAARSQLACEFVVALLVENEAGTGDPLKTFVVVPCYNEASRLEVAALEAFIAATDVPLVFVDDGSSDRTRPTLTRICEQAPARFKLVSLPHNVGEAEAIRAGMRSALDDGPECVGYWDADLATPLFETTTLPTWTDVRRSKLRLRDGLLAFRDLWRIWVRYRPVLAAVRNCAPGQQ